MKIINNITEKLSDELKQDLRVGGRLSIAAACFSVYAFEELKTQLLQIDALRFIFTSPTFLAEQPKQEQREFYIPRRNREKALHGSEFEIRLRNAFTQRAGISDGGRRRTQCLRTHKRLYARRAWL